ncbi:hypothetical protein K227x_20330 [Rubripirellula lacrimiformis]|uniref:Uncharacterized protein n=1 Tax=Rubripirellula lacrimiformis TaxID=1930273 RepID=A0A517N936_9BACT|nr:hypothetical protein [Rubripirellula lacrimiformis]QDT03649.1 hypothetical protein K227x_20330 [Rubripirellula lacrimiformis]
MKNNVKLFPPFLSATKSLILRLAVLAVIAASPWTVELAAEPPAGELESANSTEQMIRDVLEGKELGQVSDGVLEDVFNVIRDRGSILDGSILDDSADQESQTEVRNRGGSKKTHSVSDRGSAVHRRAVAAEQLLRAARLLVRVDGEDAQNDLVRQMRSEAARLLAIPSHAERPMVDSSASVDFVEPKRHQVGLRKSRAGKARRNETE